MGIDKWHVDKDHMQPEGGAARTPGPAGDRAEMVSPGSALLSAVAGKALDDHGRTLHNGAVLVDATDPSTEPRLLVYLDHVVTDGRLVNGARQVVSRRFQCVEVDQQGTASDPGAEPYLEHAALSAEQEALLAGHLVTAWAGPAAESVARDWAIEHIEVKGHLPPALHSADDTVLMSTAHAARADGFDG